MADTDKEQKEALSADKKVQQDQEKALKKEASKKVVATCSIDLDSIFVLLHIKASSEVKGCKILNSAIEGEGKNAKFHSAGSHIIAAVPLKGDEIALQDAFTGIKQYVASFNGPDVANKLKEEDLILLEDENANNATQKSESSIPYVPSFLTYLTEETDELKASLEKHDANEKDKLEKSKDDVEQRKDKLSKSSKQEIDLRKEKRDPKQTAAKGFYITYKIAIEGQKESPLADALKSFGAGLLKGLGIQGFSWKTGAKGKEHTIGDLLDTLDKVFGKIDPNELKTRFTKNIQAKYPLTRATDVQYYDKRTLTKYLGKKLDTKLKLKIDTADYSLCYKVEANDKSKKLINVTVVADAITRSIKGLFKKFKNKVDSKDVILVNDYDESDKDQKKTEKKLEVNKNDEKQPLTTDSLKVRSGKMLSEADKKKSDSNDNKGVDKKQQDALKFIQTKLLEVAKKALGENYVEDNTKVCTKDELKKIISETDAPDVFKQLSDDPNKSDGINYAFVIESLWNSAETTGESIDRSTMSSMLKMLFEEADKKNDKAEQQKADKLNADIQKAVNNAFKTLFESAELKAVNGKDYKPVEFTVYDVEAKENNKTEESPKEKSVNASQTPNYSFVSRLFESNEFNHDLALILEKADNGLTNDLAKQLISLITKYTLENIRKNKDKIINIWENRDPGKTKNNAEEYLKFSDLIFTDGVTEDEIFKFINNAKKVTNNSSRKQALTRFISALKEANLEEPEEEKKEIVKVNFYDADSKTGEKTGDPLNKEPFEVEKDSLLKDNDKINDEVAKFNEQLSKKLPEGYEFKGWNPDINAAKADKDPTEIVAKYIEEDKKDKEYTVQLMYAPDQEKPNAIKPIQVDGKDDLKVIAGEAAKMPEKMPEIEGYKFKDWGDDTEKINKVEEDIVAVAKYEKNAIEITFIDRDPNELKPDKEISKIEKEEGKKIEPPEPPKHAGWKFKEWDPNPDDMTESGETVAKYEEDSNEEEGDVEITYMDIDDPSKLDNEEEYKEMEKKAKENDDDAKAPTPKDKEGWKFEKWEPDPDAMSKSGKTYAKYIKEDNLIEIQPKAPKDPAKPDEDLEPIGDPIKIEPGKDPSDMPEAPKKEGWKFEGWEPKPSDMKESGDTIAKYTKEDEESDSKTKKIHKYWICLDVNKYLTPKELSVKLNHTDVDFYIVPMKGLKMETTDDDDSKEVEGKGK